MQLTQRHWTLALGTATLIHGAVAMALLSQTPEPRPTATPGHAIAISLGPSGGARGTLAATVVEAAANIEPAAVREPPPTTGGTAVGTTVDVSAPPASTEVLATEHVARPASTPVHVPDDPEPDETAREAAEVIRRTEPIHTTQVSPRPLSRPPPRPAPSLKDSRLSVTASVAAPASVPPSVIPAEAGIQGRWRGATVEPFPPRPSWIPASAGMTEGGAGRTEGATEMTKRGEQVTEPGAQVTERGAGTMEEGVPAKVAVRVEAARMVANRMVASRVEATRVVTNRMVAPQVAANRVATDRVVATRPGDSIARVNPDTGGSPLSGVGSDGDPGQPSGGALGEEADYLARVRAWLERHKRYPSRARLLRQEGTALLYLAMDREGKLQAYEVRQSTGHELLDRALVAMIRRAQPLPRMPDSMTRSRLEVIVPVEFVLR